MAGTLIEGAALGVVFQEFTNLLKKLKGFRKQAAKLKETVKSFEGYVKDVTKLDEELQYGSSVDSIAEIPQESQKIAKLKLLLDRGRKLVEKCTQVSRWNAVMKLIYSHRLRGLDGDFVSFTQLNMQPEMSTDIKKILALLYRERNMSYDSVLAEPKPPRRTFGLNGPLIEVKHKLHQTDVSVIGICGFGGCGKTTLALKLCEDEGVKEKFEIVFFTISKSPNLVEVVRTLRNSVQDRRTNQKPVLVVLDDVWSESDLDNLIIDGGGLIKTLVTSRETFSKFQWSYQVQALEMEDAKLLLLGHALSPRKDPEDLNDELLSKAKDLGLDDELVEKIVKGCKGHPLALKVIGTSLQRKNETKWREVAEELEQVGHIFQGYTEIFELLVISLRDLIPETVECFKDLGSFPEDKKIPAASLIDMWVETRDLSEDGAFDVLDELSSKNLVTLFRRRGNEVKDICRNYSDLYVIQHDLLRELAIHMGRNTRLIMDKKESALPESWKKKDNTVQAQIVSIHIGEMKHEDWFEVALPCAKVLILNFSADSYCLPPFLKRMENLKVLIIANHSAQPSKLSGLPPLGSLKNLRRVRFEKISVPNLSTATVPLPEGATFQFPRSTNTRLEPLQNLEKLSMVFCLFNQVDNSSPFDIPTIFPKLTEIEANYCNGLEKLPPGICEVTNLKKLKITKCPDLNELPHTVGKLTKLEVLSLHACSALKDLPISICTLQNLRFLDISDCMQIEALPAEFGNLCGLGKIDMRGCAGLELLPDSVERMKGLIEVVCDDDTYRLWERFRTSLNILRFDVRREEPSLYYLR